MMSSDRFISCGEKHLCIWSVANSRLTIENAKLGDFRNKNFLSCARLKDERAIVGTAEGDLLFVNGLIVSPIEAISTERSSVNALWSTSLGDFVVAGLKNGHVLVLGVTGAIITVKFTFSSSRKPSEPSLLLPPPPNKKVVHTSPPVRAVCLSGDGRQILVGTQECEIAVFSLPNNGKFTEAASEVEPQRQTLVKGHWKGELWGLAVRPTIDGSPQDQYCTVGDDGYLRIWSLKAHTELFSVNMAEKESTTIARSCAYSPDGVFLAVSFGGSTGKGKSKEDGIIRVYRQDPVSSASSKGNDVVIQKVCEIK